MSEDVVTNRPIAMQARLRFVLMQYLTALPVNDCYRHINDLFEVPKIREVCPSKDKLAIALSDMYRSGKHRFITRVPISVPGTNIRYAYGATVVVSRMKKEQEGAEKKKEAPQGVLVERRTKPVVEVSKDRVVVETENVRIVVHLKQEESA